MINAGEVIKFFYRKLPEFGGIDTVTTGDFLNKNYYYRYNKEELFILCQKLEFLGYLIPYFNPQDPPLVKRYYGSHFIEEDASYGVYDFEVHGFPLIHKRFSESVIAITPTKIEQEECRIGSAFLMRDNYIITARHCIAEMKKVQFSGLDTSKSAIINIWIPNDNRMDLAVVKFQNNPFPNAKQFEIQNGHILDEIMTMGYPPVPTFDQILMAETAKITSEIVVPLKATTGEIIANEKSYLTQQIYLLISARIKGGNSGGPVIGRHGRVVGVVTEEIVVDDSNEPKPDTLGFGVVTPAETLKIFLEECEKGSEQIRDLVKDSGFIMLRDGFSYEKQ